MNWKPIEQIIDFGKSMDDVKIWLYSKNGDLHPWLISPTSIQGCFVFRPEGSFADGFYPRRLEGIKGDYTHFTLRTKHACAITFPVKRTLLKHKLEDIAQICEPETIIYVCTNDVIEGNEITRAEYIGNEEVKIWGYDQSIDVLMHNFSVSHFVTEQDFIKFMKD